MAQLSDVLSSWSSVLEELSCFPQAHCPAYGSGVLEQVLLFFVHFPAYLSFALLVSHFYVPVRDVYYPVGVGAGLLVNWLLNFGLGVLVGQPSPYWPPCGEAYAMPAFATQQVFFAAAVVLLFPLRYTFYPSRLQYRVVLSLPMLVVLARIGFGYSTPAQAAVGALVGLALGGVWHGISTAFVEAYGGDLAQLWPLRNLGYRHRWCVRA